MLIAIAESALQTGQIDPRFSAEFVTKVLDILFSSLHLLRDMNSSRDAFGQLELTLDMMQHGLCGKGPAEG